MTREPAEKMACPSCGCRFSEVIDTRGSKRIRHCLDEDCGAEFDTEETVIALRHPAVSPRYFPRTLLALLDVRQTH